MGPIEILVITFAVVFVASVVGTYIYKKVKRLPTGGCSECHSISGKKLVKEYHKTYCTCGKKNCKNK